MSSRPCHRLHVFPRMRPVTPVKYFVTQVIGYIYAALVTVYLVLRLVTRLHMVLRLGPRTSFPAQVIGHIFDSPLLLPITCYFALSPGYIFSRAWVRVQVSPLLLLVTFSRAWVRVQVSPLLLLVTFSRA